MSGYDGASILSCVLQDIGQRAIRGMRYVHDSTLRMDGAHEGVTLLREPHLVRKPFGPEPRRGRQGVIVNVDQSPDPYPAPHPLFHLFGATGKWRRSFEGEPSRHAISLPRAARRCIGQCPLDGG